jgi:hypothetical protein
MPTKRRQRKQYYKNTTIVGHTEMHKKKEVIEKTDRAPTFAGDVLGVTIISFVLFTIAGLALAEAYDRPWYWGIGISAALSSIVLYWRISVYDPRVNVEETVWLAPEQEIDVDYEDEPEPLTTLIVRIQVGPNREITFKQPRAGEFANWINRVIADHYDDNISFPNKVTLSLRTAERRGWPRKMYDEMIETFYQESWVYKGRNRVPEPTNSGIEVWAHWLNSGIPSPNRK